MIQSQTSAIFSIIPRKNSPPLRGAVDASFLYSVVISSTVYESRLITRSKVRVFSVRRRKNERGLPGFYKGRVYLIRFDMLIVNDGHLAVGFVLQTDGIRVVKFRVQAAAAHHHRGVIRHSAGGESKHDCRDHQRKADGKARELQSFIFEDAQRIRDHRGRAECGGVQMLREEERGIAQIIHVLIRYQRRYGRQDEKAPPFFFSHIVARKTDDFRLPVYR